MLLFRSEETVNWWCAAHDIPRRPLVNLAQLWQLAIHWYGNRLTVESRRPAPDETQAPKKFNTQITKRQYTPGYFGICSLKICLGFGF